MNIVRRSTLGPKLGALIALAVAFSLRMQAAAAGNLPWEKPMTAIATSLTGPVAYAIGLIGIAIAGGAMLWGGELTEFGRRACMIGLVVSVLLRGPATCQRVRRERGGGVIMQTTDRPREIVIHQSANRPNQILGGDRELVLIAMLTAISLAFSLGSWWGIGLRVAFWVGAVGVLQRMGKADPLLRQIYVRHIRYKAFYPAKSGLLSRCVPIPRNWR
jgi:type IV secretory pathway TrbD component/type IV secretory pathway VirB2 component (pilin)